MDAGEETEESAMIKKRTASHFLRSVSSWSAHRSCVPESAKNGRCAGN